MSVLKRELESYQRALDKYRREAAKYNSRVDAHNDAARAYTDSLVRDESGQPYVVWLSPSTLDPQAAQLGQPGTMGVQSVGEGEVRGVFVAGEDGKLVQTRLPDGFNPREYELTPAGEGNDGLMLLRRPTDEKRVETIGGLLQQRDAETGTTRYEAQRPFEDSRSLPLTDSGFGSPWQMESEQPWAQGGALTPEEWRLLAAYGERPETYTASREVSVHPESPGPWEEEFTKREPQAPDPTLAAARRMGRPSLARMEGGLISDAIRGRGVR